MPTDTIKVGARSRFPARLHVLFARDRRTALVLRRGPAQTTCAIGWDRATDAFTVGQWVRARIYERRCDLSPDGAHLIYFAFDGRSKSLGGAWTAVSRAPYLKAVALWAKGDCWQGGGLWLANDRYWLNGGDMHRLVAQTGEVKRDERHLPRPSYGGECPGVYYHRLVRDGWTLGPERVFTKPLSGGWVLEKRAHAEAPTRPGRGCYWDEHALVHARGGLYLPRPDWEWAERDGSSVVFARAGCLYRARLSRREGVGEPVLLAGFNGMEFEARRAPY